MTPTAYLISGFVLLLLAFVAFRVVVRRDYLKRGRLTTTAVFLEWAVFILWGTLTYLDWSSAASISHVRPALRLTAWVLIVFGLGITLIAMARLGIRRMHGLDTEVLEQSGFYAVTRNPQIVGSVLAVIGYAMYWPSWHSLGWVVSYAVICHMMVLTEEEHLQCVFADEYVRYRERVPRYLRVLGQHPTESRS